MVELLERMAATTRAGPMARQLLVMSEADQRDLLPRIAVPTLLIWGELDGPLAAERRAAVRAGDPGRARWW